MDGYAGLVQLGSVIRVPIVFKDGSLTPTNTASAPTYRVHGPAGLVGTQQGTMSQLETGTITGATNATPIVITSAAHKLQTGDRVTIVNVGGNTAANGTWQITFVSSSTFSLDGSVGNGAYTSGGTWNLSGAYYVDLTASSGNGYAAAGNYLVICEGVISSVLREFDKTFTVV
jgi:hypothetical protein